MQKEVLLKILAIELLIMAFIKFEIMGKEKEEEERNDLQVQQGENKKASADIYEIVTKGKEFMGSVKPYLSKRDQYYIDIFSKVAEIIEIQKNLMSLSGEEIEKAEKTEVDKIGILKAIRPYITEDKKVVVDKFLKFHEALKNLQEKMEKYSKEDKKSIFDKIVDIYEAIRPLIPEEKLEETDKLARNIKLLEVLNKAEGILKQPPARSESEDSKGEEDKEKEEVPKKNVQEEIIENLSSMLTKEQQQYMHNIINYLKQNKLTNSENAEKGE